MPEPIVVQVVIERTPDAVWNAWTDEDMIVQWLAPEANVGAEEGGEYELFWDPEHPDRNSTLGCRILDLAEPHSLRFTWKGPEEFASLMNRSPEPTEVRVSLTPSGDDRTTLTLEHGGWGEGEGWRKARDWHVSVWNGALDQLKRYLEDEAR